MPKIFRVFCCCIQPQSCKNWKNSNRRETERNDADSHSNPQTATVTPTNFNTQLSREPPTNASRRRPADPQSIITQVSKPGSTTTAKGSVRGSLRGITASQQPNGETVPVSEGNTVASNGMMVPYDKQRPRIRDPNSNSLLPPLHPLDHRKKCLIVDLDETLVHSSFKPVKNADFVIPVEIDNVVHQVHVLKRPYTDEFLERIGELFECVLFTASLGMYADPVADLLDRKGVFRSRLFREACVLHEGNYIKDLNRLGRDLSKVIIIDNSPISYAFHPENAVAVRTWFDDPSDAELLDLLPLLEELAHSDDIYSVLRKTYRDMYG